MYFFGHTTVSQMRALVIKLIIFPLLDDDRYIHYMYAPIALSANLVFMIIC